MTKPDTIDLDSLRLRKRARVPMLLQTEAAECGLACVAMVAHHFGHRANLGSLRKQFEISRKGVTLADMARIADAMQLASRALRVELDGLADLARPSILHWDFNHFVVLVAADKRGITVHDPARGVRRLSIAEASRHFTGVALELQPTHDFKPTRRQERVRLRDLLGRVTGWRRAATQVLVLALALEVFAIISPFYLQWIVDGVLPSADRDLLLVLGVGFVLLMMVQQAISAARSWVVLYVSTLLNFQWLTNVFTHLLKLPPVFFERRHLGDVYSRFQATSTIQRTLTNSFVEAILDGVMSVITLLMMLIYSVPLALISGAAVALYAVLRWIWYRPLRQATEEQIVHAASQQSHFFETVRGIRSIQLFGRETERRSGWLTLLADQVNADVRTQKLNLAYKAANGVLFGVERIAIVWLAALLVLDNHFSIGMLFAFLAYKEQFVQRVSGLIDKTVELKMMQLQGERLADIVFSPVAADAENPGAVGGPGGVGGGNIGGCASGARVTPSIELRDIRFRYADGEPYVLDGVNLTIAPGESVAITGPSGCGKTTLLKVMIGLLEPESGEILIDSVPVRQIGSRRFREMIGTVLQDDQLFAGSLLQNVCFFDSSPDEDRIERCARQASIHDEIMAMPMAYNTLIGDMGTTLSGGQQQRVLLARALYKEPQVLFLDESTSHLDVAREKAVNAAVQKLALTRVIIAHRPETIAMAERVVRMEAGRVCEERVPGGRLSVLG